MYRYCCEETSHDWSSTMVKMDLWCASVEIHLLPSLIKPAKSHAGKGGSCQLLWMPWMWVIVDDWWQDKDEEWGGGC